MAYYVYILKSLVDESFYKGFTENPVQRLMQHNNGEMNYTSKKTPWKMVCILEFLTKKEALIAEKKLKKYDHIRLNNLIKTERNLIDNFKFE